MALPLLLLGAAQAPAAFPPCPGVPQSIGVQLKGGDESPETLNQVRELGVKWVRRGFIWEAIEKETGVYDFSKYDVFVKNCRDRGLSIISVVVTGTQERISALSGRLGRIPDVSVTTAYAKTKNP